MLVGLAPSHFILQEARRRRQVLRGKIRDAHGSWPTGAALGSQNTATAAPAVAEETINPLLQEESGSTCEDVLNRTMEAFSDLGSPCGEPDAARGSTSGSMLKVVFKSEALGSAASGKRKRGGIQLHVRMRLGIISLQQAPSQGSALSSFERKPPAAGAAHDGAPCSTALEATIFGCITGAFALGYKPFLQYCGNDMDLIRCASTILLLLSHYKTIFYMLP